MTEEDTRNMVSKLQLIASSTTSHGKECANSLANSSGKRFAYWGLAKRFSSLSMNNGPSRISKEKMSASYPVKKTELTFKAV